MLGFSFGEISKRLVNSEFTLVTDFSNSSCQYSVHLLVNSSDVCTVFPCLSLIALNFGVHFLFNYLILWYFFLNFLSCAPPQFSQPMFHLVFPFRADLQTRLEFSFQDPTLFWTNRFVVTNALIQPVIHHSERQSLAFLIFQATTLSHKNKPYKYSGATTNLFDQFVRPIS